MKKCGNSRSNYLLKNTIIFAISSFASKLIQFLLVPLYTSTLTPSEFGIVDLLFTICGFLYPLFTLNVAEAIYRFSMDKDKDKRKISSVGLMCFFISIIFGLVTIPILNLLPDYKIYSIFFYIYLVTFSFSQILLVTLKGREKLKLFGLGNIINTLFIAIFNIVFLVILKMGIKGYFLGYIVSNIITIIFSLIYTNIFKELKKIEFDKKLFGEMIKYSIVLIPTSFMWWIINSSDRIMVTNMVSSAANGIYAVSYKIPSLLTVISSIFNQAWFFSAVNEKDSKDKDKYTNEVFYNFFLIMIIVAILILIILKPLFKIYVTSNYYIAWKYVPFLTFGFIFMTLATFISTSYNVYKDSKGFLFSGLSGAITNIALNFILIPLFGVYGAAIATVLSYITVFVYRIIDTKKYIHLTFKIDYLLLIIVLLLSSIAVYINNFFGFLIQLAIIIILIMVYKKKVISIIYRFIDQRKK